MRGYIQKRGERTYRCYISLGWDAQGKRYRKLTFTIHGTREDAEKALAKKLLEIGNGNLIDPGKMTFGEYLEYWLSEYVSSLRPKTQKSYAQIVRDHAIPALGRIQLDKLNPLHLQRYLRQLKRLDSKGDLTPNTIHAHYRTLHTALEQAVKWQILTRNPCDDVTPPKRQKKRAVALTPEQVELFLQEAQKRDRYALYLTAVTMGMRIGEILALKWDDVDFEAKTIRIDETLQRGGPNPIYGPVKTEDGVRVVRMPEYLIQVLREHQIKQKKARLQLGSEWVNLNLVFTTWKGTAIGHRSLSRQFKGMLAKAGLLNIRIHDLRHTSATLLIMSGVPIKTISARLGHSSTGITQDLYGHVLQAMEDKAADVMDDLFGPRKNRIDKASFAED